MVQPSRDKNQGCSPILNCIHNILPGNKGEGIKKPMWAQKQHIPVQWLPTVCPVLSRNSGICVCVFKQILISDKSVENWNSTLNKAAQAL